MFFIAWFLAATERAGNVSAGVTQLVFKQNAKIPILEERKGNGDTESGSAALGTLVERREYDKQAAQGALPKSRSVFSWFHMNYDVTIAKGKQRRLLDDVSGFVAPGKMVSFVFEWLYARLKRCCRPR